MKRTRVRLAIASVVASASLLGLTGAGFLGDLLGSGTTASRIGGSYCC